MLLTLGTFNLQYKIFMLSTTIQFLLFQILAERHEKGSVIITTSLGFADWSQVFGDPIMTDALLDRLTHRAHIVRLTRNK